MSGWDATERPRPGGGKQVAERDASGGVADAYDRIRELLGVAFVPTVYRMLACHDKYLDAAIESCGHLLSGPAAHRFAIAAREIAATVTSTAVLGGTGHDATQVALVEERFRRANPRSLLIVSALARAFTSLHDFGVMRTRVTIERAPITTAGVLAEVKRLHGNYVVPGFWLELTPWPRVMIHGWGVVRSLAGAEAFTGVCAELSARAERVIGSTVGPSPADLDIGTSAAADIARIIGWFIAGIPAMIVEGEVVRSLLEPGTSEH